MFFKKKPTLVYLQKNSFLVYSKNHLDGVEFTYPEGTIKNHEISNTDKFSDHLETFIAENLISEGDVILVLGNETFSQKKLESTESTDQQKEVEKFLKDTDIKEEHLTKETFELDNNRYIFAIDKRIYESIIPQFTDLEWKIVSVIPVSLFRDISDTKMKKNGLSQREVKDILDNQRLVKDANILTANPVPVAEESPAQEKAAPEKKGDLAVDNPLPTTISPRQKGPLNTTVIIIASVGILILGTLAFLYTQGTLDGLLTSSGTVKEIKADPTPKPSPTAIPVEVEKDKAKLTVKILNGTGVVGQAGRVKTRLTNLEYEEIETANGDTEDNKETKVTFSPKVPNDYQKEIIKDLEKIFETVNSEVKEDADSDIEILTGTEK